MEEGTRFVLFDFDGVIADSLALSFDVSRILNPELDETSYRALYEGNIYESIRKLSGWQEKDRTQEYFSEFSPRMKSEVRLVPGMDAVVRELSASYRLAIISSTPSSAIRDFLAWNQFAECFVEVLGRDVDHSKVKKMQMLFDTYGTSAAQCVYITDTLGDMREAQQHDMGTIGVSWGVHPRETLEKGIPFRIVERPADLPDTVDEYFAR